MIVAIVLTFLLLLFFTWKLIFSKLCTCKRTNKLSRQNTQISFDDEQKQDYTIIHNILHFPINNTIIYISSINDIIRS